MALERKWSLCDWRPGPARHEPSDAGFSSPGEGSQSSILSVSRRRQKARPCGRAFPLRSVRQPCYGMPMTCRSRLSELCSPSSCCCLSPRAPQRSTGPAMGWAWALPFAGHACVDRERAAAVPEILASPLWQDRIRLERADARGSRGVLRNPGRGRRLRARDARGISELHRAAVHALRGGRRNSRHRQSARHAPRQHGPACARDRDGEPGRHHRRRHDHDPPAAAGQRGAHAQGARRRVLHHSRRQCRRRTQPAGRSAAVRRLPARRRLLLDRAASVAADADRRDTDPAGDFVVLDAGCSGARRPQQPQSRPRTSRSAAASTSC